jgi:putative ABC transport system permease protein
VRSIVEMASLQMPHLVGAAIDWRVVLVSLAVSIVAAGLGAVAPLVRALRAQPADALRGGRGGGVRGQQRALASLVVVEGSLALALLIAAGLVFTGFVRLARHDPGFDPAPLLTMRLRVSPSDFVDGRVVPTFLDPALEAVRNVPGVAAAGVISQLPYSEWGWNSYIQYEGRPELTLTERPLVEGRNVSEGYLETLGHRLLAGRSLEPRDAARAANEPMRVVVSQTLVERDFPGQSPLGQRFLLGETLSEIVGVVSDVKNFGPFAAPRAEVFWTFGQRNPTAADFRLVVRVREGDPQAVAGAVHAALRGVYPRIAIARTLGMPEIISQSLGRPRLMFALFGTLAAVALLLALAGLFGLLSYTVERQHRELGIRAALGASSQRLLTGVLRGATQILLLSTGIGLAVAWMVTRLLESFLYGVEPRDPLIWAVAVAAMLTAGVAAALAPALRAARVQPAVAMRQE